MPDFEDEVTEVRRMTAVAEEHVGPWTVDELLELPEDHQQRHELVDGALLMSPAPGYAHQLAASLLWHAFYAAAPADVGVYEAVNVQLGSSRLFIPDVAVVRRPGAGTKVLPASEVLLVAEVVSPSSVAIDRTLKPALYAAAGIPFYLRVELDGPVLVMHELVGEVYREVATAKSGEELRLESPFPVSIDPDSLLDVRG
jgi:Uma2 family endonuclease